MIEKLLSLLNKIPLDKALHIITILPLATLLLLLFGNPLIAILGVTIVAISKEIYDSFHPDLHTVDYKDAIATISGGLMLVSVYILAAHHIILFPL